jgi:D-alanyl-D-alanine carboxypeptidase (penicillin-binding protein 5/6)
MNNEVMIVMSLIRSICILLVVASFSLAWAAPRPVPAPPSIPAKNFILIDYHSGKILAEKNPDERIAPASLTKLMTAFVVFSELHSNNVAKDELITISPRAWRTPGSRMFVEPNKKVPLMDLLRGMIIQSGNDASVALAEHIAGTEETFAAFMNHHARELGLTNTHFMNSSGLDHEDHFTTARDMATLAQQLIERFPDYYSLYSEKSFTFNEITQHNRNRLLWRDASVDGVKTGFTESAGYCLVSSAEREGMRLIAVLLGAKNDEMRVSQSQALLNYGFRFFETHQLYSKDEALVQARIWKGEVEHLPLALRAPLFVTVPRGEFDKIKATTRLPAQTIAPINQGDELGALVVYFYDDVIEERPLYATQSIAKGGIITNLIDSIKLWFD